MLYDIEVAVVGLGLMGSSLAAAMRARGLVRRVVGVARRPETARRALERGAGDETTADLDRVALSDVVVLATPVRQIMQLLPEVARRITPGALVTDLGSTKAGILRAAQDLPLPFIGGHPMAGSERAGVEGCDPDLYRRRPWILIAGPRAQPEDRQRLEALVAGVGSRPVWMDSAQQHDQLIAQVSHVPYLLALALLEYAEPEAQALAGNSFRDATRVAAGAPEMILDLLCTNRDPIGDAASRLIAVLQDLLRDLGAGDEPSLRARIEKLGRRRREFAD